MRSCTFLLFKDQVEIEKFDGKFSNFSHFCHRAHPSLNHVDMTWLLGR